MSFSFPGLCDRPQNHRQFMGSRVCDRCGWARRHHRLAPASESANVTYMATTNTSTERDAMLREATLPHVQALLDGLMAQGMTREKALKTIRWATHRLTRPDTDMTAPPCNPDGDVFGGRKALRVIQ